MFVVSAVVVVIIVVVVSSFFSISQRSPVIFVAVNKQGKQSFHRWMKFEKIGVYGSRFKV